MRSNVVRRFLLLGVWVSGFGTSFAQVAVDRPLQDAGPVTVALSKQVDFTAKNGRRYRLKVALPFAPPPAKGFPVLYVLDGDAYFDTFAAAARLRSALGDGLQPAVVVGISYASDDMATSLREREFDLTQVEPDAATKALEGATQGPAMKYGGADGLLTVIQNEVKPRIAALVAVDPARSILFGHSLGGLFVLHTLFTHPEDFSTYLALSPSIWWSDRAVLGEEPAFDRKVVAGQLQMQVFLAVGGLEQDAPTGAPPPGMTAEQVAKATASARMVSNVIDLATHLKALQGGEGFRVEYKVLPGSTHLSAPWASVDTLLDFALKTR